MVQVAEGGDPHADRLALRGRGSFEQVARRYLEEHASKRNKSWRQADALVTKYLLPRWAKLDIGSIRRADVKAAIAAIAAPVLANQVLAAASAIFSWAVRQEIIAANPCSGVERNDTTSRERVLSDAEIAAFWPHLSAPLKMILLTGQRPGEVAHLHRAHVVDDRWWVMPGAPDPETSWPGTKNAQSHRVWLSEPVHELLPDVLAASIAHRPAAAGHARHLHQARGEREGDAARPAPDVLLQGHRARVRPRCDEPGDQPQGGRHCRRLRPAPVPGGEQDDHGDRRPAHRDDRRARRARQCRLRADAHSCFRFCLRETLWTSVCQSQV